MHIEQTKNFQKEVRKVSAPVALAVAQAIRAVQAAQSFTDIPHFKQLRGHKGYFRLRVGDYRIGLRWDGERFFAESIDTRGDFYKTYPPY